MDEIVVLLGAQIDLQACYEKQPSSGRAERLEAAVCAAYRQLAQYPRSSRSFDGKFRRHVLRGFPYALFYTIEGQRIMIQAALDTRQSVEFIRRRLGL